MKQLILLFCFLIASYLVRGQASMPSPGPKISFPSPQAAQMGKFGGYPLNHSSGTANINIPVYTAKEGDLTLPLSLSYYYTGFKPSEEAGWVGLGWSLNAGGVITRSVRGLRDEMSSRGYLAKAAAVKSLVDDSSPSYQKFQALNPINGANDSQPDAFSFQFDGYSGKFVLDPNGVPRIISDKKFVITYQVSASETYHNQSNNIITQWTITTENGTKYTFSNYEFSGGGNSDNFWDTSAWYVSEIVNVKGDRITLEYTAPNVAKRRVQASRLDQWMYHFGSLQETNTSISFPINYSEEIFLTKISGSNWKIIFNSEEYSKSTTSGYTAYFRKLNNIQLFNTVTNAQIKQFDLVYNTNASTRLQLLSFAETGIPAYTMQYDGIAPSYIEGNTTQVDYWGYYNGQTNFSLIPDRGSVDLEPRFLQTRTGAMTRVTYPTKGYTDIAYEQNDYSYFQGTLTSKPLTIVRSETYWWLTTAAQGIMRGPNPPLVLSEPTRVDITIGVASSSPSICINDLNNKTKSMTLNAGTYSGDALLNLTAFYPCNQNLNQVGFDVTFNVKTFIKSAQNVVSCGGLRIKSLTDYPALPSTSNPVVREFSYKDPVNGNLSSGQLSDEGVYNFNYPGTDADVSIYRSYPFNPVALSPVYYRNVKESNPMFDTFYTFTSHADRVDDLGKWAFYNENSQLAYFNVTPNKSIGDFQRYDFIRQLPKETLVKEKDGKLKQKTSFDYSGWSETFAVPALYTEYLVSYNTPTPGSGETSHEVQYNKAYYIIGGWPRVTTQIVTNYGSNGADPVTTTTNYEYGTNHLQLTKQRATQSDGTIEESNFKYPLDYSGQGTAAIQSMIAANMVTYPLEQTTILEKSPSDRKVIDARVTTYRSFTGNAVKPTLILPYKKFSFNGMNGSIGSFSPYGGATDETASASYRETVKYTHYDTQGNPLSLLINGGDKLSYLWSYKGQYPVAEIQNADNAAVTSALGGTSFQQMADMTDTQAIQAKLDGVRTALPAAQVSAYLYNPLVGVSRTIDPAGKNLVYEYDGLGRLAFIKDNGGNVRASYCYNYAGQNVSCISNPTGVVNPTSLALLGDVIAADLSPTIDIDEVFFTSGTSRDFIFNVYEVNNIATAGSIQLRFSKLSAYDITYPTVSGTSNVFGGIANENSNWSFTENASFVTVTSKAGVTIPAGGQAKVGFKITRKAASAPGTQNITGVIIGGSGGEITTTNNSSVVSISGN